MLRRCCLSCAGAAEEASQVLGLAVLGGDNQHSPHVRGISVDAASAEEAGEHLLQGRTRGRQQQHVLEPEQGRDCSAPDVLRKARGRGRD